MNPVLLSLLSSQAAPGVQNTPMKWGGTTSIIDPSTIPAVPGRPTVSPVGVGDVAISRGGPQADPTNGLPTNFRPNYGNGRGVSLIDLLTPPQVPDPFTTVSDTLRRANGQ